MGLKPMSLDTLPKKTKEVVEKAIHEYPNAWRGQVCAFQIVDKAKGECSNTYNRTGTVCHADVSSIARPSVVVNAHRATWQKTNADFMRWVCKEAPFSHGVLNKDNEDEILNHAAAIDTEIVGKGGALWLCKAMRHFTEDSWKIKTWDQLRKAGLDGFQAFIGADILQMNGKPMASNTHVSLFCYMSPDKLRKAYDEIKNAKAITTHNVNRGGYGAYGYDPDRAGGAVWGSLAGKKERKPDGWGGYVEMDVPCSPEEYVEKLKEIFEGDPKNVK